MASSIHGHIGDGNDNAVIASTIVAYALSSILTGVVFYLMGHFKFGVCDFCSDFSLPLHLDPNPRAISTTS